MSRKKEKKDKKREELLKRRGSTYSRKRRLEQKELEGLYKTLLEEVPEMKIKKIAEGFTTRKKDKGTDYYISQLTKMLPKQRKRGKRTVSKIREEGAQINYSRRKRSREIVNLFRETAKSLREKEGFENASNKKISKEVQKKLEEKGAKFSAGTIRKYLGKRGNEILKKDIKKKKKKVSVTKKQLEDVKKNLREIKESGLLNKTPYDKKKLKQLPNEEIQRLKKVTDRVLEEEKGKIEEIKDIKELYTGEERQKRIELNKLGYSLSEIEQTMPLCSKKEKNKLMKKARENPHKSLFKIKEEL